MRAYFWGVAGALIGASVIVIGETLWPGQGYTIGLGCVVAYQVGYWRGRVDAGT